MIRFFVLALTLVLAPLTFSQEQATSQEEEPRKEDDPKEETPGEYSEHIVVTAARTEQELTDATSFTSVRTRDDFEQTAALTLDDQLRRVPGFNLFRRSSGLVAHPTTQGVSLRGIGPSGASRSLALWDGLPLNDPFGGWIYWNRLPLLSIESAEVVRGATSQLYGSSALGGTIQLLPRAASDGTLDIRAQLGSSTTYDVGALASDTGEDWSYLVAGRVFGTDGYYVLSEEDRGEVDRPARTEFQNFLGRFDYGDAHVSVQFFREERDNGTELQENDSKIALVEAGIRRQKWDFSLYSQWTRFKNTFSRVLPDRSEEFITARQDFPTLGVGSSLTLRPGLGFQLGADWRRARWDERKQNLAGVFLQNLVPVHPSAELFLGARVDLWQNQETQATFNPRAGILWRFSDQASLRSSVYRGFRAPTLNELYRPFRVGNVVTEANPDLGEETLWGFETGVDFYPSRSLLFRVNGFWNSFQDVIANVTIGFEENLILRQRQNAGEATIKGVELEGRFRFAESWQTTLGYLYSDAVFDDTERRIPQTARHQGILGLDYNGLFRLRAEVRWVGRQFDDDLNELSLERFGVVDINASKNVTPSVDLFVQVQNLFDNAYSTRAQRRADGTLLLTLGTPRLLHGGIRWRLQ